MLHIPTVTLAKDTDAIERKDLNPDKPAPREAKDSASSKVGLATPNDWRDKVELLHNEFEQNRNRLLDIFASHAGIEMEDWEQSMQQSSALILRRGLDPCALCPIVSAQL